MAEFRFAIESVNHLSVREIADELERSEKAVWDMVGNRGIPARFQDGYSVRELSTKLHIRRPSIRTWIKAGLLHKKRNGRIAEDSLQSFLYNHPERINWPLLDEDTHLLGIRAPGSGEDQGQRVWNADARQLSKLGRDDRRLKLPRLTAALPVRPKLIHPRIPCRIITERVAPALSNRSLKELFVGPLQKAKPEKFLLTWMLSGVFCCVFQKARTALSKHRGERVRHGAVGLDAEPEPI